MIYTVSPWVCGALQIVAQRQVYKVYAPMPAKFEDAARLMSAVAAACGFGSIGMLVLLRKRADVDMLTEPAKDRPWTVVQTAGRSLTALNAVALLGAAGTGFVGSLPAHVRWGVGLGVACVGSFALGVCSLAGCLLRRVQVETRSATRLATIVEEPVPEVEQGVKQAVELSQLPGTSAESFQSFQSFHTARSQPSNPDVEAGAPRATTTDASEASIQDRTQTERVGRRPGKEPMRCT